MLNNIIIGRYFRTDSKVHKMNPFFKVLSLIFYIVVLFRINEITPIIIMSLFLGIIIFLTKIPLIIYFKSVYGLRYLVLSFIFINLLLNIEPTESIVSVSRLVLIVLYSTVLSLSTKPLELMSALETLFKPLLLIKIPIKKMSFILVNALRFIPILIDNTNDFLSGQYEFLPSNASIKEKISSINNIMVPIFINSIGSLDLLIVSLELKLYDFNQPSAERFGISRFDIYFIFAHVLLLGGILLGI